MRTKLAIAALILGAAAIVGCNKDNSTTTPPAPQGATPPAAPTVDTSKVTNAINNAADATKAAADKGAADVKNAINSATPTTMPSMPTMK